MKAGRPKEVNSIRSLGDTRIAIDQGTKKVLKELAAVNQMTMADYIRAMANSEAEKPQQTVMPEASLNMTKPFSGMGTSKTERQLLVTNKKIEDLTTLQLKCQLQQELILKYLGVAMPDDVKALEGRGITSCGSP